MVDLEILYTDVMDFILKLRNENTFDDGLYRKIYQQFEFLFKQWETQDNIPKSAFISCIYLVDMLAGSSRFWSDEVCIKAEDAIIAMQELIANIDNHPPHPL